MLFFLLSVNMSITIDFGYVPSIEVLAVFKRGQRGGLRKKKLGKKKKKRL